MDPLRLFLLDQGFPVEYELDSFPHCVHAAAAIKEQPERSYNCLPTLIIYY